MASVQPDLFSTQAAPAVRDPALAALCRRDAEALLAQVRGAERLPWDATGATLAELRFEALTRALPEAEALRAAFAAEMDRLDRATFGD
jgi:hypothetical protein